MVIHASNSKNNVIPSTHQTHHIDVDPIFHLRLYSSAVLSSKAPSCSSPHCKLLRVVLPLLDIQAPRRSFAHTKYLVYISGIPMPGLPLVAVVAKAVEVAVAMAL